MERYQNADLLALIGRGSRGGQARVDGSRLEPGVHLRWQIAPELGFPQSGFDLYRREENIGHYWRCGVFREADVVGLRWIPIDEDHARPGVALTFSGEAHVGPGCTAGASNAAIFSGEREVRARFERPVRGVRLTFPGSMAAPPTVEAYANTDGEAVLVARAIARPRGAELTALLFADRIDFIVLRGTDMVVCELCFVLLQEGRDLFWPQAPLNGSTPIYLPITHPDWGSPHPHAPDDQAEAEARLPSGLPATKRNEYADGFRDELHDILFDIVGTDPQRLHRLTHADEASAATIEWPGTSLLQMLALDPNLARVLGLYWHDEPPSRDAFYDYRVVAHYGDVPFPGRRVRFSGLDVGKRLGTRLERGGLAIVSPNPIDVVRTTWAESHQTGLRFARDVVAGPIAISLAAPGGDAPTRSITLHLVSERVVTAAAYLGTKAIGTQVKPAGEITVTFEEPGGITQVLLLPAGPIDLVSIVLRGEIGVIGDLVYDVFHVRANAAWPHSRPRLEPPTVVASPTGLSQGRFVARQSRVDLRWDRDQAGRGSLNADAPIFYLVERTDFADDGTTVRRKAILNPAAPTLVADVARASADAAMYSDRGVPDGEYGYAVRGIDLFGVLGDWGPSERVTARDRQAPPPPQAVEAQYLDPADPWLGEPDQEWARVNGTGLKLRWQWPGLFALQAPDVTAPEGEFRVYFMSGALNRLDGQVTAVTSSGATSTISTDLEWPGAVDALAGQSIRVNQDFFSITANSAGSDCRITVVNLTAPTLAPDTGPCSLSLSADHPDWRDYRRPGNWPRRLAETPVIDSPQVASHVRSVTAFDADAPGQIITRPGATRTVMLDEPLTDPDGVLLPGALLCDGVVFLAYGHTLGTSLAIHIVPAIAPGDNTTITEPAVGAACSYFPGRQFELRVGGVALPIAPGAPNAVAHLAMASADADDNESSLSPAVMVQAIRRTLPSAVGGVPVASPDPIVAEPANYYGQARYTLTWPAVPGVAGYAVYRCSGAALFDQDRRLRQTRKGPYTTGSVFADDAEFSAWLADLNPDLTEAEMMSAVDQHLDTWRAWSARFYPTRTDLQVQALAEAPGSESAFRRVTPDDVVALAHTDTFDGRGQGIYLYRVRSVDAAGNLSPWPDTRAFPPVHIFDVTPPAAPVVTGVFGGEKHVVLRWRANREADLREYRIWRDTVAARLGDVRRSAPTATVSPSAEPTMTWVDEGLAGLQSYFYKIAAVDTNGNVSPPTPLLTARVADSQPPAPPIWERTEWVRLDAVSGATHPYDDPAAQSFPPAVALTCLADQLMAEATFERRSQYERVWRPIATMTAPVDAADPGAEAARRYVSVDAAASTRLTHSYRVRLKDLAGKINTRAFNEASVPPPSAV